MTKIEWTEKTWNPITGCEPISAGCKNCYAKRMAKRLKGMGQHRYRNGFKLTEHPEAIDIPRKWKKPRMIFVCSMGDIYLGSDEFIKKIWATMEATPQHTYQVLTKRPIMQASYFEIHDPPILDNVWLGTTVEHEDTKHRVWTLSHTPAIKRFLSIEPLLGPLPNLDLSGIDWVIVGGEAGPGSRPMNPDWVRDIRDQCVKAGVAFFFKQWGGLRKKEAGKVLDGRTWQQLPT